MKFNTKFQIACGVIISIFLLHDVQAQNSIENDSYEAHSIHAFLKYCLPALTIGENPSRVASMAKLPELSPEQEKAFLSKPGKAFFLPEVGNGIILSASDASNKAWCAIAVQKLDAKKFIEQVNYWFDPANGPFHVKYNSRASDSETVGEYTVTGGKNNLRVTLYIRDYPKDGSLQVDLSAGIDDSKK